ncbi:hypothetical protein JDV02_008107 [Purpureocillium takamizusanense]|uniref:Uncharacterized protein n=1 Tax=Purpureocillium takamizusanense TaxID=2060973 RepID=A0A9Q8QN35_9HYPO|nr:uncharacterized protein JDV02_008107 [Purpureocillium takamizusanense]UNI22196.1 hypothetical protein JDV02_008107 [Purpureocillium takamizusanense]
MRRLLLIITLWAASCLAAPAGQTPKAISPDSQHLASRGTNPKSHVGTLDARHASSPDSAPKVDPADLPRAASSRRVPRWTPEDWPPKPSWAWRRGSTALPRRQVPPSRCFAMWPRTTENEEDEATPDCRNTLSGRDVNLEPGLPNEQFDDTSPVRRLDSRGTNPKAAAPNSHLVLPRDTNPKRSPATSLAASATGSDRKSKSHTTLPLVDESSSPEFTSPQGSDLELASPESDVLFSRGTTHGARPEPPEQPMDSDAAASLLRARDTNPEASSSPNSHLLSSRDTDPETASASSPAMSARGTEPKPKPKFPGAVYFKGGIAGIKRSQRVKNEKDGPTSLVWHGRYSA